MSSGNEQSLMRYGVAKKSLSPIFKKVTPLLIWVPSLKMVWRLLVSFSSVLALEGIWKIFEFSMDTTTGTRMQHGLADIMNGNTSDTLAGIVAGILVAAYIVRGFSEKFVADLEMKRIGGC